MSKTAHSEAERVRHILDSGWKLSLMVTGAGGSLIQSMMSQPGASQCLVKAFVPYSSETLRDVLLEEPAAAVSQQVATRMAWRALETMEVDEGVDGCLGVGLTAAIGTNRDRRGEEQFFAAIVSHHVVFILHGQFDKGVLDRDGQEAVIRQTLLERIAVCCGLERRSLPPVPGFKVVYDREQEQPEDGLVALVGGASGYVLLDEDGRMEVDGWVERPVLLSGSFRPLHAGHLGMAMAAEKILKRRVLFELSIENVDKSALTLADLRARLRQTAWARSIVVTRAPRFLDKARLFPGGLFVVGFDTAVRLVDPAYYDGADSMRDALAEIRSLGCRFLVAGRRQESQFRTLSDVEVPHEYADLFQPIPEAQFRLDVSSTDIRAEWVGSP